MSHFSKHIFSQDDVHHFVQNGYVRLPQLLTEAAYQTITDAIEHIGRNPSDDAFVGWDSSMVSVANIDNILRADPATFLPLMGDPLLLSIAEAICGVDFFPVQAFSVIKTLGSTDPILWHQDVLTRPLSKTFMLGIYLDDANDENGALRIIPQSHKSALPICELEKMPYQSIDMKAGEILIHDLMLVHSSGLLSTSPRRRVVYFEFMSSSQAIEEQIYPTESILSRVELIPLAIQAYRQKFPNANAYEWKHPEKDVFSQSITPDRVHNALLQLKPANYCFPQ
jgi:hypothetical protein